MELGKKLTHLLDENLFLNLDLIPGMIQTRDSLKHHPQAVINLAVTYQWRGFENLKNKYEKKRVEAKKKIERQLSIGNEDEFTK